MQLTMIHSVFAVNKFIAINFPKSKGMQETISQRKLDFSWGIGPAIIVILPVDPDQFQTGSKIFYGIV